MRGAIVLALWLGGCGPPQPSLADQFVPLRSRFGAIDEVFATRVVDASTDPYPLPWAASPLGEVSYEVDGQSHSVDDFMRRNHAVGLIVVHRGQIVLERYDTAQAQDRAWISFSVTKSVVSLLVGIAIAEGHIGSVDELAADHLTALDDTPYADVTIRELLRMSTGVPWRERYGDGSSDVSRAWNLNPPRLLDHIGDRPRDSELAGFHYNTGEVNLLGAVVERAVGEPLDEFLGRAVWQRFGMESDATWVVDADRRSPLGGCCLSASLRDSARIGLFVLQRGKLRGGTTVLPEHWIEDSKAGKRYGYLWWLYGGPFAAVGVFGQMIWIDPGTQTVVAIQSAWPKPLSKELADERRALLAAIRGSLRGGSARRR